MEPQTEPPLPLRMLDYWVRLHREEDPQQFFSHPALLPFAVLAQTRNSEALLRAVAERVNQIQPDSERRELSTVVQLMAGLQYKEELIESIFREGMMRESVMYQKILRERKQEGERIGEQRG
ncbi:hypothetical protein RYO59_001232 [Thermosynechococcaceae cyanobacterium Okahandja]